MAGKRLSCSRCRTDFPSGPHVRSRRLGNPSYRKNLGRSMKASPCAGILGTAAGAAAEHAFRESAARGPTLSTLLRVGHVPQSLADALDIVHEDVAHGSSSPLGAAGDVASVIDVHQHPPRPAVAHPALGNRLIQGAGRTCQRDEVGILPSSSQQVFRH